MLPYIWECNDTAFPTSESTITPVVGFCGLVNKHRKKIIQTFKKSNRVESNFIIRDKFWGGDPHNSQLVDEYEANIKSSQFVLCNRGRGNFSMRFYQTLAFGRIPVLVNTDMVLPFENEIPWKDLIVFEKSEKKCLEKVIEIHKKDEITHRQKLCREFFDKFFHKDVVFSKLLESALKPQKTSWWSRLFA
ncbi:glycosyltransferase family 47 protein [Marinoscillum pacificum]|uniref:glycosyltransferase family 47 protein n=1 Tax=Marinoscillum pacificum TaxID=392723 RepID=UPI0021581195|nr:glycosyltransferase family 47 protein [Marinoscillum pacificum]